ncbi:MAG: helix-turn-helix transcriptional regulator [Marinobacterium sp.]|nr:helix-turn-helix transcriptional regulator [Marinobacterium sp.]
MMDQQLLDLISAIYSAASSPDEWPEVARKIQRAIGGHSVHLAMSDPVNHRIDCIFSNSLSSDETRFYNQHVAHRDELTNVFNRVKAGTAFLLHDHFSEQQLNELDCYVGFYDRVGLNDFAASYFYRDQALQGWCTVARSKSDAAFTQQQRDMLNILTPHLARATHISLQLSSAQQTRKIAQEALELLPLGIVLLSSQNRVVGHNNRATPFLRKSLLNDWVLELPCPKAQQQLLTTLSRLLPGSEPTTGQCISFDHESQTATAIITPWVNSDEQAEWLPMSTCAMVMINSNTQALPLDWLRQRYTLSKAEARTLSHLLTGASATQIADMQFVTTHTVRFHIKNLLLKTESNSQTQMVAQVLRDFSGLY